MTTRRIAITLTTTALLIACGGSEQEVSAPPANVAGTPATGDPGAPRIDPPPPADPVPPPADPVPPPTDPVAPPSTSTEWVLRESFGFGTDNLRPAGGDGDPRSTLLRDLDGFWVEYPGSGVSWAAPNEAWQFAACTQDPYEPPTDLGNGCAVSPWKDALAFPDAIVPFAGLAGPYQVSADLWPSPLAGAYVAIGLTSSAALTDNLRTSGQLWLLLRHVQPVDSLHGEWELRAGGLAEGTVLASGSMTFEGYNQVALRYDPVAGKAYATVGGVTVGPVDATGVAPLFVALEGQGHLDNLQVRPAP